MPMPSAAEYAGTLSGIDGAKDWPDLTHEDLTGKAEAEQAAYLQRVSEHYRPQRDMIQAVANLALAQLKVRAELVKQLAFIESQQWDLYASLPPGPLPGTMSPLALTKLAPAMGAGVALLTFLETPIEALGNQTPLKCLLDIAVIGKEESRR